MLYNLLYQSVPFYKLLGNLKELPKQMKEIVEDGSDALLRIPAKILKKA
ncbi:MAG: hypothetical protein R3C41_11640 [Calditrichia bacterium]